MARRSQRRLWQGLFVFLLFNVFSGTLQNAVTMNERNVSQAERIREKEKRSAALERRQRDLVARLTYIQSDPGKVAEARVLGFQKAGERRVMFDNVR